MKEDSGKKTQKPFPKKSQKEEGAGELVLLVLRPQVKEKISAKLRLKG